VSRPIGTGPAEAGEPGERPIEGAVSLKWHVQRRSAALIGWMMCATLEGTPLGACTANAVVHSPADGLVAADLTMLAGEDDRPLWDPACQAVLEDGKPKTRVFRFYVTSIETCVHDGGVTIRDGKCQLEGYDPVAGEKARITRCATALTVALQRPALGAIPAEAVAVVPVARLAAVLASPCIDTCDADCENGPVHCTWIHDPSHKPGWHSPEDCPAAAVARAAP
jgi:hypothetical protein